MRTYVLSDYGHTHYPPDADDITTFEDLFQEYLMLWPEVVVDAHADRWPDSSDYARHIHRLAIRVAAEFPNIELWDYLESSFRHSLHGYDPKKGTFDKLFERNLRERLRKEETREAIAKRRRRKAEQEYAIARSERPGPDEIAVGFNRWASLLLDRVCDRLDHRTRAFILMRRSGVRVADIALILGQTEQSLKNQYGGQKLASKVRQAIKKMVLELPDWQRRLLGRHLLEEVELRPEQVRALLGVAIDAEGAPVLSEEWLLKVLGW